MRTLNGKKSVEDERNDLIYEFLRLVKKLRPKTVMMENVPGLMADERLKDFKEKLEKMGYKFGTSPQVLNVAEYGVPQRRRRMILMASQFGIIPFAPKELTLSTVREAIANLPEPGNSGDVLHDKLEKRSQFTLERISNIPKNGGSRTSLPPQYQLECHKKYPSGFKDVYGRMKWDDVSPTITGGCTNPSKGRFLHPEQNRAITLREAALLQSFRPDYQFSLKKGKDGAALMIGNALPPEFIKRQATQIKNHLLAVGKQAVCA
jgi:DNA (cytosine-5)-methyltransferase 1